MSKTVVITGGTAGVGRACAEAFARRGWSVGIIARDADRLAQTERALRAMGAADVLTVSADIADAAAVDKAAAAFEKALGPIEVWVNNVMTTVFAALSQMTADEFRRVTEVTYLGQVYGTMAALRHMRPRRRGRIIQVGSGLSYRSVPLQSAYCGAKHAIRGFTDSLRSELIHDQAGIDLCMIYLPAMNTPQFGWARNRMPQLPYPAPPIYQPQAAARAVVFAALNPRREIWVGRSTLQLGALQLLAPGLGDRLMAARAYAGQMSGEPALPGEGNLFAAVEGPRDADGRWPHEAQAGLGEMWSSRQRDAMSAVVAGLAAIGLLKVAKRMAGVR